MIVHGIHPGTSTAPHEYGAALDAAAMICGRHVQIVCDEPHLEGDVYQRWQPGGAHGAAIYVEPLAATWRTALAGLARDVAPGAPLVLLASTPLARALPERAGWSAHALGLRPNGLRAPLDQLRHAGFRIISRHLFHTITAVFVLTCARLAARLGWPARADTLEFLARAWYRSERRLALGTVELIVLRRTELR